MITMTEFELALEDGTIRKKAIGAVCHDFPHMPKSAAEEVVQMSLMNVWKQIKLGVIINTSVETAIIQNATLDAIDWNRRETNKRKAAKGYAKNQPRMFDSTRQIDFKIDLERAIDKCAKTSDMEKLCIFVLYAGFTVDDVLEEMRTGSNEDIARMTAYRTVSSVRKEMRRKGYRRMGG